MPRSAVRRWPNTKLRPLGASATPVGSPHVPASPSSRGVPSLFGSPARTPVPRNRPDALPLASGARRNPRRSETRPATVARSVVGTASQPPSALNDALARPETSSPTDTSAPVAGSTTRAPRGRRGLPRTTTSERASGDQARGAVQLDPPSYSTRMPPRIIPPWPDRMAPDTTA